MKNIKDIFYSLCFYLGAVGFAAFGYYVAQIMLPDLWAYCRIVSISFVIAISMLIYGFIKRI